MTNASSWALCKSNHLLQSVSGSGQYCPRLPCSVRILAHLPYMYNTHLALEQLSLDQSHDSPALQPLPALYMIEQLVLD